MKPKAKKSDKPAKVRSINDDLKDEFENVLDNSFLDELAFAELAEIEDED